MQRARARTVTPFCGFCRDRFEGIQSLGGERAGVRGFAGLRSHLNQSPSIDCLGHPPQSLRGHLLVSVRFRDLIDEPFQVGGKAALDRDLEDLRELVEWLAADEVLDRLGARFHRLDEEQRLMLALELALLVIEGMDHRDHRAAGGKVRLDQPLADALGVVAAAGRDHDQDWAVAQLPNCQPCAAGPARRSR